MRSDEVSGPDIARYHEGSQKLAKLVAETSDCALPPLSSVEQNAFAIIASGDAGKVAMGLASIGSSPASDIFGRSMLHVALDEMVNRASSPSLPSAFEEKDIQELVGRVDLDQQDAFGRTALHIACSEGLDSAALIIVQGGARLNLADANGMTPLHWAFETGCENFLRAASNTEGFACLLNSPDSSGRIPLSMALDSGLVFSRVDLLLRFHEKWLDHEKSGCTKSKGMGLMHLAARRGDSKIVAWLMKAGFHPFDYRSKGTGRTPLVHAAAKGHAQVVKALLDHPSVDPDSQDEFGRTPLSYAAARGNEEMVRLLIGTMSRPLPPRIDLDKRDNIGRTPLFFATVNRRRDVAMLLMATNGVNPEAVADDGQTPLSVAEGQNDGMDMHKILLKEVWSATYNHQVSALMNGSTRHPVATPPVQHGDDDNSQVPGEVGIPIPGGGKKREWAELTRSRSPKAGQSGSSEGDRRRIHADILWPLSGSSVSNPSSGKSRTSVQKLEGSYLQNFFCCDQALPTLHDLVQHCEQVHGGQGIHPGPKGIESIQED